MPLENTNADIFRGDVLYSNSMGKSSLKEGRTDPFTPSTICAIASMTKLLTSVAVLQCVEKGLLQLDDDARSLLPDMGKYGIITGFDDEKGSPQYEAHSGPITLRMLLCHTSGHEYDWLNPLLGKWRAARSEGLWSGPTVSDKSALPLVFPPGTSWAYGAGSDWAGKAVAVASKMTLHEFMLAHIWKPLGIETELSFWPRQDADMAKRMADMSTLGDNGEPPAVDDPVFDILIGGTECLGGGGGYASAQGYYTFLSALLRRDARLLTAESYEELFRPQLDEHTEQAFNDFLARSPAHTQFLAMGIPHSVRKSWSLAGLVALEGLEGRFEKGTTLWGGVPSMFWFIDHAAGSCGTAFCQILPPMQPAVIALHAEFQKGVLRMIRRVDSI